MSAEALKKGYPNGILCIDEMYEQPQFPEQDVGETSRFTEEVLEALNEAFEKRAHVIRYGNTSLRSYGMVCIPLAQETQKIEKIV